VTAPAVAGGAGAAVDLGVPSLAAESGGLGDGEARDAVLAQGVGDRLQGVGLDDGGDQLHRLSPVAAGWGPAFAAGGPAPAPGGRGLRGSRSMGWGRGTDAAREDRSRRAARAPPRSYPASAWWLRSMPARSSASGILQPKVTASTTAITAVSTPENTIAASAARTCTARRAYPPPNSRPPSAVRTPMPTVPTRPPTRCTPTTSRESSTPRRCSTPTARAQAMPAVAPSTIEVVGVSAAVAGVIATSPATTPGAMPSEVMWQSRIRSTSAQPSIAPAVATVVFTQAVAPASRSKGSMAAPGREEGRFGSEILDPGPD